MTNIRPGNRAGLRLSIMLSTSGSGYRIPGQPVVKKLLIDQSGLDLALVFSIIKISPRNLTVPAAIDFHAQPLWHVLREDPLFYLTHSIALCASFQLRRIT